MSKFESDMDRQGAPKAPYVAARSAACDGRPEGACARSAFEVAALRAAGSSKSKESMI